MASDQTNRPLKTIRVNWAATLSALTALVAVGAVILHVIGAASHRSYLRFWGIDSSLFPQSADVVLLEGYYGVVDQSLVALLKIFAGPGLLVAALAAALFFFLFTSPMQINGGRVMAWLSKRPAWTQRLARWILGCLVAAAYIPVVLYVFIMAVAGPDSLGSASGEAHAEREARDFMLGCEKAKQPCIELKKGGQSLGTGFVLVDSPSHIAIFDAQSQRARVVPRDSLEMVSGRAPLLP